MISFKFACPLSILSQSFAVYQQSLRSLLEMSTIDESNELTIETLIPSTVPAYLRDSEFGASLNYDDDEEFSVPSGVTKPTPEMDSLEDLSHLLATARFWGLQGLPANIVEFAFTRDRAEILSAFEQYSELDHARTLVEVLKASGNGQMNIAMRDGYLDLVKYLHDTGIKLTHDAVRLAIENDHADCLQYALQRKRSLTGGACPCAITCHNEACIRVILQCWPADMRNTPLIARDNWLIPTHRDILCDAAAFVGDIEYLGTVRKYGRQWSLDTADFAASNGQLDCLKYLRENGCTWNIGVLAAAVRHKHFDCAAYALQNWLQTSEPSIVDAIVAAGELSCLQLLGATAHARGKRRIRPCIIAAQHGHLQCLTFLHEHKYRWSDTVTLAATEAGHYDCLWYAVQHGCPVDARLCSVLAKRGGEQRLLQFAHLDIASHMGKVAICAAGNGYMNCLTYAVEHGCPRTPAACAAAAGRGKLECLQYLHTQGFPMDHNTTRLAARRARYDCLEYALQQGCPSDVRAAVYLAAKGPIALLQQVLQQFGYCGDLRSRTRTGSSEFVGLAHDESISVVTAAARGGHLACLLYLHEQLGFPVVDKVVSAAAVRKGQWECVRYLAQQGCAVAKEALRHRP